MKTLFATLACFLLTATAFADSPEWDKAMEAYRAKDWDTAIVFFLQVDKDDPKYATAMRYAGYNVCGRELGQWDKAVAFCVIAYQANPEDPKVMEDLGRACLQRQKELEDPSTAKPRKSAEPSIAPLSPPPGA